MNRLAALRGRPTVALDVFFDRTARRVEPHPLPAPVGCRRQVHGQLHAWTPISMSALGRVPFFTASRKLVTCASSRFSPDFTSTGVALVRAEHVAVPRDVQAAFGALEEHRRPRGRQRQHAGLELQVPPAGVLEHGADRVRVLAAVLAAGRSRRSPPRSAAVSRSGTTGRHRPSASGCRPAGRGRSPGSTATSRSGSSRTGPASPGPGTAPSRGRQASAGARSCAAARGSRSTPRARR